MTSLVNKIISTVSLGLGPGVHLFATYQHPTYYVQVLLMPVMGVGVGVGVGVVWVVRVRVAQVSNTQLLASSYIFPSSPPSSSFFFFRFFYVSLLLPLHFPLSWQSQDVFDPVSTVRGEGTETSSYLTSHGRF